MQIKLIDSLGVSGNNISCKHCRDRAKASFITVLLLESFSRHEFEALTGKQCKLNVCQTNINNITISKLFPFGDTDLIRDFSKKHMRYAVIENPGLSSKIAIEPM